VAACQVAHAWPYVLDGVLHGDDWARSVAVDSSGNVIATGNVTDSSTLVYLWNFPVVKLDGTTGALIWRTDIAGTNGPFGDQGNHVLVDQAGDVFAAGYSTNNGSYFDFTVAKLDGASGQVVWRNNVTGTAGQNGQSYDVAQRLVLDGHGDVLAAGAIMDTGIFNDSDFAVVKLSGADGTELWRATINGETDQEDYATAIAVDAAGNAFAAGTVLGPPPAPPYATFFVASFAAADGAERWRRSFYDVANTDWAYDVAVDAAGDVVAIGERAYRGYVTKLRGSDGSTVWEHWLGGTAGEGSSAYAGKIDSAGDVYVTGDAFDDFSGTDLLVWKLAASDGHEIWRRPITSGPGYTDLYSDYGYALALDGAGNVAVGGALGAHLVVSRLRASDGTELTRRIVGEASDGYGVASAIVFDPAGDLVAAGSVEAESSVTERDFYVTKVPASDPIDGCGNGVVEYPEWCDDGNDSSTDACLPACMPNFCANGVTMSRAKFQQSQHAVKFDAWLAFPPSGVPGGFAPQVRGAQILIERPGDVGATRWLDLTAATRSIPPGGGCDPRDAWTGSSHRQVYRNVSGALPPTCTAGSAAGLASIIFDDRSPTGKGVRVKAKFIGLPMLPPGPLRVSVALGGATSDASSGVCGLVLFPPASCQSRATNYRCK
jgi:cysteine-rich repeat protein